MLITYERLRELLDYNPDTGVFTWKIDRPRAKAGSEAGCKAKRKKTWYLVIRISQVNYYAHKLAFLFMTGEWPTELVDHRNRNGLDNRWDNLRHSNSSQNVYNRGLIESKNKTGFIGVHECSRSGGFVAQIASDGGPTRHLGTFLTAEDAARARDAVARELHSEFAVLNFPDEHIRVERLKVRRDSSNPYRGVTFIARTGKYSAHIKNKHLGYFKSPEEAACMYDEAAVKEYGNRAILNFS